jgi:hypothetical protein
VWDYLDLWAWDGTLERIHHAVDELRVIELQPGVMQLYVPITFMISPAGQTAQPTRFLMDQVVVKTADGKT